MRTNVIHGSWYDYRSLGRPRAGSPERAAAARSSARAKRVVTCGPTRPMLHPMPHPCGRPIPCSALARCQWHRATRRADHLRRTNARSSGGPGEGRRLSRPPASSPARIDIPSDGGDALADGLSRCTCDPASREKRALQHQPSRAQAAHGSCHLSVWEIRHFPTASFGWCAHCDTFAPAAFCPN